MSVNKYQIFTLLTVISLLWSVSCNSRIAGKTIYSHDPPSDNDSTDSQFTIRIDTSDILILPPSTGVQFYRDGILFLSSSKYERKMVPGHISFGKVEAYYRAINDTLKKRHKIFAPAETFNYPCEAVTFSGDFNIMYFTKYSEKYGKEKIYRAEYKEKKKKAYWETANEPLEFCRDSNSYMHPALSDDGLMMIFSSDRENSEGGMDLFISHYLNGSWTEPSNAGKHINTKENEVFPFLDDKGNLFFSSNGHNGYGGYDIFMCHYDGNSWEHALNPGSRINSANDEFAFTMEKKNGHTAFFSIKKYKPVHSVQLMKLDLDPSYDKSFSKHLSDELYLAALADDHSPAFISGTPEKNVNVKKIDVPLLSILLIIREGDKDTVEPDKMKEDKGRDNTVKAEKVTEPDNILASEEAAELETEKLAKLNNSQETEKEAEIDNIVMFRKENMEMKANDQGLEETKLMVKKEVDFKNDLNTDDKIEYKVQFLSTVKPLKKFDLLHLDGVKYDVNEYFYKREYRYTVGNFSSAASARQLQHACQRAGYTDAFVAAFKNGKRCLDIELFIEK